MCLQSAAYNLFSSNYSIRKQFTSYCTYVSSSSDKCKMFSLAVGYIVCSIRSRANHFCRPSMSSVKSVRRFAFFKNFVRQSFVVHKHYCFTGLRAGAPLVLNKKYFILNTTKVKLYKKKGRNSKVG